MQQSFNKFYESTFRKDIDLLYIANEEARQLSINELMPALEQSKGTENIILNYLIQASRQAYLAEGVMLAILLD